ncbi:MAG: phage portal protein [Acidimicrobiia bacterium]|nr:phage portal protein [Acidimicrobiia bacterium]
MSRRDVLALFGDQLRQQWTDNRVYVDRLDEWYRGVHNLPALPAHTTAEYQELQRRSATPWGALVVTAVAQSLYVDGYRAADSSQDAAAWRIWQANGMDSRQIAIHRGALAHGVAYATVQPGALDDEPMPVIRGVSARKMVSFYDDPAEDEWALFALRGDSVDFGLDRWRFRLYDAEAIYMFESGGGAVDEKSFSVEEHGVGRCPVVRYSNMLDLDGRSYGEIEPLVPLLARIDQDTFDRLVVQRFGAWKVRYGTGMAEPETDVEREAQLILLKVGSVLMNESPDAKFGTLDETPLGGYIDARDADIRDLAAVSQTPPHHLLGQVANLSAEALSAAEAGLSRKVQERKHTFGESHEQVLRLAADLTGEPSEAGAEVRWRDMESRSLAQTADALGKLAQMLGVPVEALWERVPGVTQQDVERWKALAAGATPPLLRISD